MRAVDDGQKLKLLDLFSGIGGFSLGLERSGYFKTVAFCEIEKFPRRVLAKHWPEVPCYEDIRTLDASALSRDGIAVDAICGGFPCQDISFAGKGAGLAGERSGLWFEYARIIGEVRPKYVIVENVAALLGRGLDAVLGTLAALGYDAEWHCIPAWFLGAPHGRDRVWIIAYARSIEHQGTGNEIGRQTAEGFSSAAVADTESIKRNRSGSRAKSAGRGKPADGSEAVADAARERWGEAWQYSERSKKWASGCGALLADASPDHEQGQFASRLDEKIRQVARERQAGSCGHGIGQWATEPAVGRVAHGVPNRVDRLKGLGNAVVPQIPELIGHAIGEYNFQHR